jgi:hypothetical protein
MTAFIKDSLIAQSLSFAKFLVWDHPTHWAKVLPSWITPQKQASMPMGTTEKERSQFCLKSDDPRQLALNGFLERNPTQTLKGSESRDGIKIYKDGTGENPLVFICTELPGLMVKFDGAYTPSFPRVFQAEKMKKIISEQNLDLLYIPQKYLAQNNPPNRTGTIEDYSIVLAEKLDLERDTEFELIFRAPMNKERNKEMLRQLLTLIVESGIDDVTLNNVGIIKSGPNQGKLAIFDTDPMFLGDTHRQLQPLDPNDSSGVRRILDTMNGLQESNRFLEQPQGYIAVYFKPETVREVYKEVTSRKKRDLKVNIIKAVALRALLPLTVLSSVALGYMWR